MNRRKTKTIKDIALCFGERTGLDVTPRDIRVRGNWLFHVNPCYTPEEQLTKECVDCYFAADAQYDSGILCMEPYSGVKLNDSPFIKGNNKAIIQSLKKLDKSYKRYLEDIGMDGLNESGQDELKLLRRQGVE